MELATLLIQKALAKKLTFLDKEIGAKNIENVVCGWYSCTGHANDDGDHELTAPPEIAHVSHSSDITC